MQTTYLSQNTIDTITKPQKAFFRLEVDIRGITFHRISQQCVHKSHHRLAIFIGFSVKTLVIDLACFNLMQDAVNR